MIIHPSIFRITCAIPSILSFLFDSSLDFFCVFVFYYSPPRAMNVFKHLHRSWLRQSDRDLIFFFESSFQVFPLIFKSVCKTHAHPAGFQSCKLKRINRNNCLETLLSWLQFKQKPVDLCSCSCLTRRLLFFLPEILSMTQKFLSSLSITTKSVVEMDCRLEWWWALWDSFSFWRIKQKERRTTAVQIFAAKVEESNLNGRETKVKQTKGIPDVVVCGTRLPTKCGAFCTYTHTHTRGRERKGYIVYILRVCYNSIYVYYGPAH